MKVWAHELVAKTCQDMAEAMYEELMKDNEWRKRWQGYHPGAPEKLLRKSFVKRIAPTLPEQARATLARLLAATRDDALKEQIAGALIADDAFRASRNAELRRYLNG